MLIYVTGTILHPYPTSNEIIFSPIELRLFSGRGLPSSRKELQDLLASSHFSVRLGDHDLPTIALGASCL